MHPEQIKAAIRMSRTTPAAIADELGVSSSAMSSVINGRSTSHRIREHIAQLLGKPADVIWPPRPSLKRKHASRRNAGASA